MDRFGTVDCDPGPCVTCRGSSGERRHFVTIVSGGEGGAWPVNHICRACTRQAFEQIQALLDGTDFSGKAEEPV